MLSKRKKESLGKYDIEKLYSVDEACTLLKEISSSKKFDESIDLSIRLGVDPKKPNQMVRGVVFSSRYRKRCEGFSYLRK